MYYTYRYASPLGGITMASDGVNLTGLWFDDSSFRKRVWEILLTIPFGQVTSYGKIAAQMAGETSKPVSAQAVGGAVGHNAISLIIPCHRVVGADGCLTGYAGGINKKLALLKLEGVAIQNLFLPKKRTANPE